MLEERFELAGLESGTSFSRELESVAIWKHQHYQNPVLHTSCKAARDQTLLLAPNILLNASKNVCQASSLESILSFLGVPSHQTWGLVLKE